MKYLLNIFTAIFLVGVIALGVLFALQNQEAVPLDLLVYSFPPKSIALWVLAAFGIGGLAGMLASSALMLRSRASLGSTRRQLAKARAELDQVRDEAPKTIV